MTFEENLIKKYIHYQSNGNAVFFVTLSTFITSAWFAHSDRMSSFWNKHFIHRVKACLPYKFKNKIDHDYVIERSPDGFYHYHGLLALPSEQAHRIWKEGKLVHRLDGALQSFKRAGKYRPFCVNAYEIEPAANPAACAKYFTKTCDYISSHEDSRI